MSDVVAFVDEAPSNLAPFPVAPYMKGALDIQKVRRHGARAEWVRPWRFLPQQVRALSSCAAWHPAMYAQMARATAGVAIEFSCDADQVFLDIAVDPEPKATTAQVELAAGGPTSDAYDGVAVFVDGRECFCAMPEPGARCLAIDVAEARRRARPKGTQVLPGFESLARVEVWLPCLRGAEAGGVYHTGARLVEADRNQLLLCLGDSITQGFLAGDPALAWASRVARASGFDLLNQGVGGQVFQPSSLAGLEALEPAAIWVALGTNYRFGACNALRVGAEIRQYFSAVDRMWPDVKTYVATPLRSDEKGYASHARSCYDAVPSLIAEAVAPYAQMELVDGHALLDFVPKLYADPDHPSATGHAQMAQRIRRVMKGLPPKEPRPAPENHEVVAARDKARKPAAKPGRSRRQTQSRGFEDVCLPLDFSGGADEPGPKKVLEPAPVVGTDACEEGKCEPMPLDFAYETHHDGSPLKRDEKAAVGLLAASGELGALVMCDTIARGGAKVRYVGDACVCLDTSASSSMLWASDPEEAELAAEDAAGRMITTMCERVNAPVREAQGYDGPADPADEWRLCAYLKTEPIETTHALTIDPLDGSWAGKLRSLYSHPEFYTEEDLRQMCDKGHMWGAFDERCDFVGFIGLHPDGAMGLLEILPPYRRHGYAQELVGYLTNRLLERGWLPWGQIFCDNEASLALQDKLGTTVGDDRLLCSLPKDRSQG